MKELYGTVCWFNPKLGYGFITPDNGDKDIFVYYSDLNLEGFKTLQKDQKVSYELGENKRGQLKAIAVSIIK